MPSRKPKFVISLQSTQGKAPPLTFEVTGAKAERVLELLDSDIAKYRKKTETVSATLEPFFMEKTNDLQR